MGEESRTSESSLLHRPRLGLLIAGVGLCADYYDLTVVNLVRDLLCSEYPVQSFKSSWQRSLITASSIVGAVVGQLLLGALADRLGRRRLLLVSGTLTCLGAAVSAAAVDFGPSHVGLWATLVAARFIMGVGVGGGALLNAVRERVAP